MDKKTVIELATQAGFEILETGNGGAIVEDRERPGDALFEFANLLIAHYSDAEVERLRAGYKMILESSNIEMCDGDLAREIATEMLVPPNV